MSFGKICERRIEFTRGPGIPDFKSTAPSAHSVPGRIDNSLNTGHVVWVHEVPKTSGVWNQVVEHLHALLQDVDDSGGHACDVSARMVEAGNEANCYGVDTHHENDGDCRSCSLGGEGRQIVADCQNKRHLGAHEIGCHFRQPIIPIVRPALFDTEVLAFNEAGLL